jgi:hypothetical protein
MCEGNLNYAAAYHEGKLWLFDFWSVELYTNFELVGKLGEFGDSVQWTGSYSRYWVRKWPRGIGWIVNRELGISLI